MRSVKRRHHDLEVWQDSLRLVELIYQITDKFPQDERFGLTSQLRRASVSVQIAGRLKFLTDHEGLDEILDRVFAKLGALINYLKKNQQVKKS